MKSLQRIVAIGTIIVPFALLAACSERTETPDVAASAPRADADNSGRNERDRSGATLTPLDQGSSEADRTITQLVRQGVMDHDGFSVNAKNVKIITQDGVVTLRGPVANAEERTQIGKITANADGVKRVDNQLEVETNG